MKYAIVLILFAASTIASATTYYVSTAGNDSSDGLTISTPWKTVARVNASFDLINPGDKILFRSGDTFYGTVKISKTGTAGNPITIGSYGTGGKPVITGFSTPISWTNLGSGIYSASLNCESAPEMVTINGIQYALGRWPNSEVWPTTQTWASIDSFNGVTSITDSELGTTGINWTGAELVVRNSNRNKISVYPITNQSGNTITFSGGTTAYPVAVDWGYFIQNDKRTLDKLGEWYYDPDNSTFFMYFGSENPESFFVNVATRDNIITIDRSITYCIIENVVLAGANRIAINGSGYNHNSIIRNCDINYCGFTGLYAFNSAGLRITDCHIDHCNDNAISILDDSEGTYIGNNELSNMGLYPGMGQSLYESGKSVYIRGNNNAIIEYNKIRNSGHSGIHYSGNNIIIRFNYIDVFGVIKEDCCGVQYSGGATYSNMKVLNNVILNGLGSPGGKPAGSYHWVAGVGLDYYTTGGYEISNNTIYNVKNLAGISLSGSQNVVIKNNTVFDCSGGVRIQELGGMGSPTRNVTMTGNIIFSKNVTYTPMLLYSTTNDFNQFGNFNYNYYARPLNNSKPVITGVSGVVTARTMADWQALSGQDLNSGISPVTLKDTSDIDFYYNITKSDKTFLLPKPMVDVKGVKYAGTITLAPFTSVVLMVDPDPVPESEAPVYLSSSIPVYPTILVMNFDKTLANIVPSPSAFIVKVNSVSRPVKSVIIYGSTVRLYLETGVNAGDIVTVSYSKPLNNPLQSEDRVPAASITDKSVVNQIIGIPPVYVSAVIPVYPTIMVMNYDKTLANNIPSPSAYNVKVNSLSRPVKSVLISGSTVRLYLETGVNAGDIVTVSYTRPASNFLQSESGVPAESITDKPVLNQITGIPPVFVSAVIPVYPTIMVINYDQTLANTVPSESAFNVKVNSVSRPVKSVLISGSTVRLYLETGVNAGDIVTVSYTRPASSFLQSESGVPAESITDKPILNQITGIPPVFVSAVIPVYPTIMVINYDQTLANTVPSESAFNVKVNSVSRPVKSIIIYGSTVRLYLETGVNAGDIVTVSYTRPLNNPLQSDSGVPAGSVSDQPVTNQITGIPPVFTDAIIPTYPTIMLMNYDRTLATIAPPASAFTVTANSVIIPVTSVIVGGTAVRLYLSTGVKYGDIVTVSYSRSATNPLQSDLGVPAASISNQPVINNIAASKSAKAGNTTQNFTSGQTDPESLEVPPVDETSGNIKMSVYPNPASEFIKVKFQGEIDERHILRIYDLTGKICYENRLDTGSSILEIPLNLNTGIYYVKMMTGKLTICNKKVIVVR